MESVYQGVCLFNRASGNEMGDIDQPDWAALERQAALVMEEAYELVEAIRDRNMTELRDAVCDISVTNYGMAYRAGMDYEKDMGVVNASNMSKFLVDSQDEMATEEHFRALGVNIEISGVFPRKVCKSMAEQTDIKGKVYPEGKILKNANWLPPVFD